MRHKSSTKKAEKRSPGRPATVQGKRVQVYLDHASLTQASALGAGNVSNGIRIALKQSKCKNKNEGS